MSKRIIKQEPNDIDFEPPIKKRQVTVTAADYLLPIISVIIMKCETAATVSALMRVSRAFYDAAVKAAKWPPCVMRRYYLAQLNAYNVQAGPNMRDDLAYCIFRQYFTKFNALTKEEYEKRLKDRGVSWPKFDWKVMHHVKQTKKYDIPIFDFLMSCSDQILWELCKHT